MSRLILCAAVGLVLVSGQLCLAQQPDKKDPPKPLPDDVVKAWKDAGAKVGWVTVDTSGIMSVVEEPKVGAIPTFHWIEWKDGVLAKLPAPEAPFGLDLWNRPVTDAGLKELGSLKTLTYLALYHTKITDAGLKDLAALENLTVLDLSDTKVTDAGLKELQKALPKCQIIK